ncbi:SulP family inorganic anion transporter [Gemmatimonadota bacterium]
MNSSKVAGREPGRFGSREVFAGLGVALVAIPQSLAYAELAGLPAQVGLFAAAVAPLAAAGFASSPWLQTGPVALTALLTLGALVPLAPQGTADYVGLAALLALVVGAARVVIGRFRLGWMAYFLSQPILMGFTAAAALLIIGAQLPAALGIDPPVEGVGQRALWSLLHPEAWEPVSLGLSVVTAFMALGSRRVHPLLPGALLACLVGLGFSYATGYGGAIVGEMPRGLPVLSLSLPWGRLPSLFLPGIVIAMVGFAEAASVAQTYATRERTPWDPDREFVSQGVANLAAGLFGGFPVGGSFSRSSLTYNAGARTRWAGFTSGLFVLFFLPFAWVLAPLPKAVLSVIVITAVAQLVKARPLLGLLTISAPQALVGWATFFMTLAMAPHVEEALILSVVLALGIHVWREVIPGYTARIEGNTLCLDLNGVLWFGSAPILERALLGHLERADEVSRVVIDLSGLGRIDVTGALLLKQIQEDVGDAGMDLVLAGVPAHAHRILQAVLGWEPIPGEGGSPQTEGAANADAPKQRDTGPT